MLACNCIKIPAQKEGFKQKGFCNDAEKPPGQQLKHIKIKDRWGSM